MYSVVFWWKIARYLQGDAFSVFDPCALPLTGIWRAASPFFSVLVLKLAPFSFLPPIYYVASQIQVKEPYLSSREFEMEAAVH